MGAEDSIVSVVTRLWTGWTWVWFPVGAKEFLFRLSGLALGLTRHRDQWVSGIPEDLNGWGMNVTMNLHLVPWLRMSGPISLFPLYGFISCTGTTLPSTCT